MYSVDVMLVVEAAQYVRVPPVMLMVMALLVADAGTAHVAFEVITHVTMEPLVSVVVV
jgi:hypothetical protein